MDAPETVTASEAVTITENAAGKVKDLIQKEGNGSQFLRLFVTGGGCSGMSYGMSIEEKMEEGDQILDQHGVKVLVDEFSLPFLKGTTVDYVESLMGAGFVISNPNAKSTCGCGHSFHT